jgi:cytochrome c-type biogenesis protein CcmH
MSTRRQFIVGVAGVGASAVLATRANAMQTTRSFAGPMEQDAYRSVTLAPVAGAGPSMTDAKRDELEHQIKCQCGCVLDVYTCRTTDFSCSVSPAMHQDVMTLVQGGHNATQILAAFQAVYGEQVLMSPLKRGFNLVGYLLPSVALVVCAVVVAGLIRRWGAASKPALATAAAGVDGTPEELATLNAAVRDDS